jgi:uncharacterized protein YndB with AHSA1/START domain
MLMCKALFALGEWWKERSVDPDRIEREIVIEAPPERVWEALTTAEHLGTWFGDAGATIDLRPGGELVCHWERHGSVRAVVEVVEPASRFRFRWSGPLGEEPVEGNTTTVEFTLAPIPEGTKLRVVETGFTDLSVPPDEQRRYREDNVGGWREELDELREYLVDARG